MAQLNKAAYEAKFNDSSTGIYKDGQAAGAITEGDHRIHVEDTADSTMFLEDNFIDEDSFASDSATKAPSQQSVKAYVDTSIGSGSTTPDTDVKFFEQNDFLIGTASVSGWTGSSSGTGAAFGINAPGFGIDTTENVIGLASLSTGTTTSGRTHIFKYGLVLGTHAVRFRFRAAVGNLSDGTDTYSIRMGLSDLTNITTGDPDNGVFFRYTHSVNSGEYEAVSFAATSDTVTDTNVAATTTYKVFEIAINQARTEITYYIDGSLVATHSTDIPANTVVLYLYAQILKSAGTTDRALHFDWTEITLTRTSAR